MTDAMAQEGPQQPRHAANGTTPVHAQREGPCAVPARVCDFEGCGRPVAGMGLCTGHRWQRRNGKTLTSLRKWSRVSGLCQAVPCTGEAAADGLCHAHWQRRRKGVPDWQSPINRRVGRAKRGHAPLRGVKVPKRIRSLLERLAEERGLNAAEVAAEVLVAWEAAQRKRKTARGQEEALCEATAWTQRVDAWEDA